MPEPPRDPELVCVYDPLLELMARFENVKATRSSVDAWQDLSIEDALKKHIVDGVKKGLEDRLETALLSHTPLEIINSILLDGMAKVGELFGSGKMQLPFVLQSAEVMKTSVRFLEPRMEKTDSSEKGSILLATVAGDVHDIGKNLVDIILSNNGYRVVNIGIKQPIQSILDHAMAGECQVIGMSGLLVKSTVIMKENLLEMNRRNLSSYPVILGGAALTRGYVEADLRDAYEGDVFYAKDAFEGLSLMGQLCQEPSVASPSSSPVAVLDRVKSHRVDELDPDLYEYRGVRSDIVPMHETPRAPFFGSRSWSKFDIFELYKYVNPVALFRGQWQFKRPDGMGNTEFDLYLEENATPVFQRLGRELATVLRPRVKWGYFPCASDGNDLIIYEEDLASERLRFNFPRQRDGRRLCLADFFRAKTDGEENRDVVGFSLVTVGTEVSVRERALFEAGEFQDYLFTHGMGVEVAEGLAEYWHRQMRFELGIADAEPESRKLLFSAKYHGARYSFGYPACPNLEDQAKLFELLEPQDIGVNLSEEFMLVPEQSTSAIVVHHPMAKYFNIR